ncbi:hypothetical protein HG536_0B03670 [Torulaspora globosa]|uniref:Carboxymuconolactone decarboxylase-like domain-containing protein n=1 Tax=Torulaspora globosa TaxID=48254 RepID=A0A7G3ZDB8_9SACH|nr:uncharacterized protein HG536_0B03670 [Torulaspora globosa]QLL31504.1 hypothetical protein HG536_0B03670 [Torulaspora globosa]
MVSLLNAQRLVSLAQFDPKLKNIWYLIAAVTFSVCNQPQEIPKLYHYALLLNSEGEKNDVGSLADRTIDMLRNEKLALRTSIDELYPQPSALQRQLTERFREAFMKSGPLGGLPKAINVLTQLKEVTPTKLLPSTQEIDPFAAASGGQSCYESVGRARENPEKTTRRGLEHWNQIYSKVSKRVANNLNTCYPDLWYYTLAHVYGPLLSYDEILSAQETNLIIIASLVPQDVSPQLRGHLKGALNLGCDRETVDAARNLAILVSGWCGIALKSDAVKL